MLNKYWWWEAVSLNDEGEKSPQALFYDFFMIWLPLPVLLDKPSQIAAFN